MSENLGIWRKIEAGGTLTLSVQGKSASDKNFTAVARIVPTSGRELRWFDHQINPGPKQLVFAANIAYSVRVGVKFLGSSTERAIIAAHVTDASGGAVKETTTGKTAYSHEVSGKVGSPMRRATLILLTN